MSGGSSFGRSTARVDGAAATKVASRVAGLCAALDAEPLFHASLGSKELFHSNLLAWMTRQYPAVARQVLKPWLVPAAQRGEDRVRREAGHLDLIIELDGYEPLVIENKTFSIPDMSQLKRYATGVIGRIGGDPALILLSLIDPGWADKSLTIGGRRWTWISYRQLSQRLELAVGDQSEFAEQVLAHEAHLLVLLHELIDAAAIRDGSDSMNLGGEVMDELTRVGVAAAVGKARAHQVMARVRDQLEADAIPPTAWPQEVGFSRGHPLMSAFWKKSATVYAGWQYQNNQWRLAMILRDSRLVGRTPSRRAARATYAGQHPDFFNFEPMYELLDCPESDCLPRRVRTAPTDFNRYDPDFVYQYRLLPETTVEQFVNLAVNYSRAIATWRLS